MKSKAIFFCLFIFVLFINHTTASTEIVSDEEIAEIEESEERVNLAFIKSRDILECIVYIENFSENDFIAYQPRLQWLFNLYSRFINSVMNDKRRGELLRQTYSNGYAMRILHDDFHLGLLLGEVRAQTEIKMKRESIRTYGSIWSFYDYDAHYRHEIAPQLYNLKKCDKLN